MKSMVTVWRERKTAEAQVVKAARRFARALFVGRDADECRRKAIPLHNELLKATADLFQADKQVAEWKRATRKRLRAARRAP